MKSKDEWVIIRADSQMDPCLKKIGMACYEQEIDPHGNYHLVRLLFLRYFSKRKFKNRRKQGVMIFCLKYQDEIVGFYELEKDGLLSSLYVLPSFQHNGFGKALLEEAIKQARGMGLQEIYLDASEFAQDFYDHQGFRKFKESRQILGITLIPMKKRISKV